MEKKDVFNIENAKAQMRKGTLEISVLAIISEGEVYASDIIKKLIRSDIIVVEGTLYPLLSRLKRSSLVEYEWRESVSGPPRKYYSLTSEGARVLNQLAGTWDALHASIKTLMKKYEKSI